MPMQIRRTPTPNNPPATLAEGQLAVEMADPLRLWCGVPTTIDASGRRLLNPEQTKQTIAIVNTTQPATPDPGDLWWNPTTQLMQVWNGTAWQITGLNPDALSDGNLYGRKDGAWSEVPPSDINRHLIRSAEVTTAVSSVDWFYDFDTSYDQYEIWIFDVAPVTDSTVLVMACSVDGATFFGLSNYANGYYWVSATGTTGTFALGYAGMALTPILMTNQAQAQAQIQIQFFRPWANNRTKMFGVNGLMQAAAMAYIYTGTTNIALGAPGGGLAPIRGLRFWMNAGNIARGSFKLYGIAQ